MEKQGIVIHPEELTNQMIDILKKTNINVLGLHPVGGGEADKTLENFLQLFATKDFQDKLGQVRSLGIAIEYEMHALSWMMPRTLYETHPEWFRMNKDGERVNDYNLCVSNQEALDYLSDGAEKLASILKSDTGRYYLWADDALDAFCNCEKCQQLSPSDQGLMIYHAMLKGIRRVDANAKQCYLAYHERNAAPKKVKPEEGIFLEYAPMWRDTMIPMADPACEKNVKFCEKIEPLLAYFGKKDAQVLEYWLDNSLFSDWKKPPKPITICVDTIRKDILFYKKCGFEGITTFGCYLSDDYIELHGKPPIVEYGACFE
ncbi:MAG: DUF4838 domain-containing protein [Lachnospiraceae bacterium]|nr:DUF4838 domain-containing protein [Lachnospiraceae bacterium]